MAVNTIHIDSSPAEVFDVLADGWRYSGWVVGASHMRAVDPNWPAAGSRLHHAAGSWPVMRRDDTVVEASEPPRLLALTARGRPFGTAAITLELSDDDGGTLVTMTETPSSGPGRWLHNPATEALLARRNTETLARLKVLVEKPSEPRD